MPRAKGKPEKVPTPGRTTTSRGRQFRRDGMGQHEADKNQPEWKRFHELKVGTTLVAFVADSGMSPDYNAAAGHIRAGRITIGEARQQGPGWVLERPLECTRVTDPQYVIVPPCVIRGGWKEKKVAIITGVASG